MNRHVSQYSLIILCFTHLADILIGGQIAGDAGCCPPVRSDIFHLRVANSFNRGWIGQCRRDAIASIANKSVNYYTAPQVICHGVQKIIRK